MLFDNARCHDLQYNKLYNAACLLFKLRYYILYINGGQHCVLQLPVTLITVLLITTTVCLNCFRASCSLIEHMQSKVIMEAGVLLKIYRVTVGL